MAKESFSGLESGMETRGNFFVCYDDGRCEIEKGGEGELAKNFENLAQGLDSGQKLALLEPLLGGKFLTEEHAEKLLDSLDPDDKEGAMKYIIKLLRPQEYKRLVFDYFQFIKRRDDEVREMAEPAEADYRDARRFKDMLEFIVSEAPDKYADFAVFDELYDIKKEIGRKKTKSRKDRGGYYKETSSDSKWLTKAERIGQFINNYESAVRAAESLKNHGGEGEEEKQKILFYHLADNFPEVVLKNFKELSRFITTDRLISLTDIFWNIARRIESGARQAAENKYPRHIPHRARRAVFEEAVRRSRKTGEMTSGRYKARRQELIEKEEQRLKFQAEEDYLRSLPPEQIKIIQDAFFKEQNTVFNELILRHPDIFFKNSDPGEIYGMAKQYIEQWTAINGPSFKFLQSRGLEDRFVKEAVDKRCAYAFKELCADGGIMLLKPRNMEKVFKMIEKSDYRILMKNPEVLAEHRLAAPKEKAQALLSDAYDSVDFLLILKDMLEYSGASAENSRLPAAYKLSKKEIASAARAVLKEKPEMICEVQEELIGFFSEKEIKGFLAGTIKKLDARNAHSFLDMRGGAKPVLDKDQDLREMLVKKMKENPEIAMYNWRKAREFFKNEKDRTAYLSENLDGFLKSAERETYSFPHLLEDIKSDAQIFDDAMDKIKNKYQPLIPKTLRFFISDKLKIERLEEELWPAALAYFKNKPAAVLDGFSDLDRIFRGSPAKRDAIAEIIKQNFKKMSLEAPSQAWYKFGDLISFLGIEDALSLFWDSRYELADEICKYTKIRDVAVERRWGGFSKDRQSEFIKKLIDDIAQNWPMSLYSDRGETGGAVWDFSIKNPREIVYRWIEKTAMFPFFSKELRNLYTASEKLPQESLLMDFMKVAKKCATLSFSPAKEIFIMAARGLKKKEAEKFLDAAYGLVELGKDGEWYKESLFSALDVKGPAEISEALFKKLKNELAEAAGIRSEDVPSDAKLLERPAAFIVYCASFKDQPEILAPLKEAVRAEFGGNYKNWRYFDGKDPEEALRIFKELKFLPPNLTLKQYEEWARDEKTEKEAELGFDANDINSKNREIIKNAISYRHYELKEGEDIFNAEKNRGRLFELEKPLKEIQAELSEYEFVIKKNKERKKEGLAAQEFDKNSYETAKKKRDEYLGRHQGEIDLLRAYDYLGRLANLSNREIMQGGLGDKNKKGVFLPFERIFSHLSKIFKNQAEFLIDINNIKNNVHSLLSSVAGKNTFIVSDETDFTTSLEIGERPVSSCQNWRRSSEFSDLNKGLVAYVVEPSVKIFTVRGESGNLIARAVARLLGDKNGNPALYLEPVYSANPSPQIEKMLFDFGAAKAKEMGVFFSRERKSEDNAPEKIGGGVLLSHGSRSKYSYVDSANGLAEDGKFTIRLR